MSRVGHNDGVGRSTIARAWLPVFLASGWAAAPVGAQGPTSAPADPPVQVIRVGPATGTECPSVEEVAKAISDRPPDAGAPAAAAENTRPARLELTQVSPGTIRIELIASSGTTILERTLEALTPGALGRRADEPHNRDACVALADTISLIVQRYFKHLEYRDETAVAPMPSPPAPPAPPPPAPRVAATVTATPAVEEPSHPLRTVLLGAVADLSGPFAEPWGASVWTPSGGLGVQLGWTRLTLLAQGSVGGSVTTPAIADSAGGTFSVRPASARLAAGLLFPFASVVLVPCVAGGADLLFENPRGLRGGTSSRTTEPILEAGARFTLRLGRHAFVEPHVFGVLNLRPHDFHVTGLTQPVLRTERAYLRTGLSFGFAHDLGV